MAASKKEFDELCSKVEKMQVESKKHRQSIIEIEKQHCERSLVIQGIPMLNGARTERPDQTLKLLWEVFLPHFKIDPQECWIESAVRLGAYDAEKKKIPAIKVAFLTPDCRHMVLGQLPRLRGVEEAKNWSVNVELPLLLRPEAEKYRSVAYQWRQENEGGKADVKPRGQGLAVHCRKKGKDESFFVLSEKELKEVWERYKRRPEKEKKRGKK